MPVSDAPVKLQVEKELDALVKKVEDALNKIEPEYQRLKALHARLTGHQAAPAMPISRPRARGRTASTNGGSRYDDMLRIVAAEPGLKIPDIAKRMGLNDSNYLYRVAPRLEKEGKVRKDANGGWYPVDGAMDGLAPDPARIAELEAAAR